MPGFEPGIKEPKSFVLPLHHIPIVGHSMDVPAGAKSSTMARISSSSSSKMDGCTIMLPYTNAFDRCSMSIKSDTCHLDAPYCRHTSTRCLSYSLVNRSRKRNCLSVGARRERRCLRTLPLMMSYASAMWFVVPMALPANVTVYVRPSFAIV